MVSFDLSRQYPSLKRIVVEKLHADEIRPTTKNIDNLFRHYISDPLGESGDIPVGRLPVIVVDGLDECGGLEGQASAQREALMKTLHSWSQMPTKFKLVVTSRGEMDIERTFRSITHFSIVISTGEHVDTQSSNDIRTYFNHEFRRIVSDYESLSDEWPEEPIIDALTKKAAGLFIWAKTVIRFIEMGSPKIQLELISEGSGFDDLTRLYSRLLVGRQAG
jgi:hypothetical protein